MCCWSLLACTNTGRKKKVGEDVKSQFEKGVGQMLEISLLENIFFQMSCKGVGFCIYSISVPVLSSIVGLKVATRDCVRPTQTSAHR